MSNLVEAPTKGGTGVYVFTLEGCKLRVFKAAERLSGATRKVLNVFLT